MKVGLISFHSFSHPGGVKRHILGLAEEFKKRGIKTKIIVPRQSPTEKYGNDIILLGTSFPFSAGGSQTDFCVNFNPFAIKKILDRENFDILHFHNFGFPSAFQILELSKSLNILTFHSNPEKIIIVKNFPGILYIFNKIVRWKMDGIIGVAPLVLKIFKGYKGPTAVIPNGIDLNKFNPNIPRIKKYAEAKINPFDKLRINPEQGQRINILFLGRIEKRKGLIYLLKTFKILIKKYPNLRLIVGGDGPLKKYCQNWIKKNKLKDVVFEGTINEADAPYFYSSCDIFCSPSIYGESFGIVLIEAMATGKPVVAFANKGYKEILANTKGDKFLVKPKDYKSLAEKLEILIKNEKLRKEMGQWGIKEAQKYSWPKIADQVLDFYELCRKKKSSKIKN